MAIPPVVAVVVAHDPGPWFEETLQSLADQTYPTSRSWSSTPASQYDPTARVAAVLPDAYVRRLDDNPGFGAAANEVLGVVEGAASTCSATTTSRSSPTPSAPSSRRRSGPTPASSVPSSSTGTTPSACCQVGMAVDKTGVLAPVAEPGELDQEQHDAVRDVFVVPGACTARPRRPVRRTRRVRRRDRLPRRRPRPLLAGPRRRRPGRHRAPGAGPPPRGARRPRHRRRRPPPAPARHRLRIDADLLRRAAPGPGRAPGAAPDRVSRSCYAAARPATASRPAACSAPGPGTSAGSARSQAKRGRSRRIRAGARQRGPRAAGGRERPADRVHPRPDRQRTSDGGSGVARPAAARCEPAPLTARRCVLVALLVIGSRDLILGDLPAVGELARFPDSPFTLLRDWFERLAHRRARLRGVQPTGVRRPRPPGHGVPRGDGGPAQGAHPRPAARSARSAPGAWPGPSARSGPASWRSPSTSPSPCPTTRSPRGRGAACSSTPPPRGCCWRWPGPASWRRSGPGCAADDAARVRLDRRLWGQILGLGLLLAAGRHARSRSSSPSSSGSALALARRLAPRVPGRRARRGCWPRRSAPSVVAHRAPPAVEPRPVRPGAGMGVLRRHPAPARRAAVARRAAPVRDRARSAHRRSAGRFLLAAALPLVIGRAWRLEWAVRAWLVALAGWGVAVGRPGGLAPGRPARPGGPPGAGRGRARPWPRPWAWPPSRSTCARYRFGWRQAAVARRRRRSWSAPCRSSAA